MNRILWNERPVPGLMGRAGGDIDEIVVTDCTVHIEQMNDGCYWIGITKGGAEWMGNIYIDDDCVLLRFNQQENDGLVWERDDSHE